MHQKAQNKSKNVNNDKEDTENVRNYKSVNNTIMQK